MSRSWEGKEVLVTGADGFMGSHLTERLLELGANVSVYVRSTSKSGTNKFELKNLQGVQDKLKKIIAGDIGSKDSIELIRKAEPEHIFHLAADAYVPRSFDHPIEVKETNLDGTLNVLHAAMDTNVKQIVCTSSSEVYGTHKEPIKEEDPMYPSSPYGASKAAADRYCFAYWNTYKLPVVIIRPFNTYGPRHTYDVVPKFIDLALKNEPLTVYGTGEQSRDLTYVSDMIEAFILMGSGQKSLGEAVNFGTGKDTKIKDLAEKIVKISNSKSKIEHVKERLSEVTRLCCDYSKAKRLFGWEPRISIDEGLKKNIEWSRDQLSK